MKICLATQHHRSRFIPLSLLYIEAYLVERLGCPADDIDVLEFGQEARVDDMVRAILAGAPAVVGLSCYVWNITRLLEVSRRIKETSPATRIVLGGPEVGPVAASVLAAHPAIDVIVKSEGEIPFSELVDRWRRGENGDDVKGICFRHGPDVVENEDAPLLQDLNELPSPHLRPEIDYAGRIVCIETQRGCVFRCNFCFYNKDLSVRNRRFDLGRVKNEILVALEQDADELYLMDPIFNLNAARAKEICRFVIEHNHQRIKLHAEVWAEFIDEELASLMRDANFQFLEVGLQTTDETTLATVERRLKQQKFVEGVAHLKTFGLDFELQLIYGLPGETVASFRKSLNFGLALDPPHIAVFPLMVLPGTELWRKAAGLRLEFDPEPPYFVRSHFSMSAADVAYGRRAIDAVDRLKISPTIRILSRERRLTFADLVDEWIAWRPADSSGESTEDDIQRFILHVCGKRRVPVEFYRAAAAIEAGNAKLS